MILLSLAFAAVFAHNWVNSLSRAGGGTANAVAPTLPSTGSPQVQVIPGQPFQIEWVQGHGGDVYFMFLSAKDEGKLSMHSETLMTDYVEGGGSQTPPTGKTQQFSRSVDTSLTFPAISDAPAVPNYFVKAIADGDPLYITRDPIFGGRFYGAPNNKPTTVYQLQLPPSCLARDRAVFYSNSKYPWLIGAHRYSICKHNPTRPNVAEFKFPANTAPGRYMIHYRWRGYWDVIDVSVVAGPNAVTAPYGTKLAAGQAPKDVKYNRVPHCEYLNPKLATGCAVIVTDAQGCLDACSRLTATQCVGVNVISAVNRAAVYDAFANITNIPYDTMNCKKSILPATVTANTKICYGLTTPRGSDVETAFYTTTDPEDPAFESTCYQRMEPVSFDPPPPPPPTPQKIWDFGLQCISCPVMERNALSNFMPLWPVANTCVNCDAYPDADPNTSGYNAKSTPAVTLLASNMRCDGQNGQWMTGSTNKCATDTFVCARRVMLSGQQDLDVSLADAAVLVADDARCSKIFYSQPDGPASDNVRVVYCLDKDPCCAPTGSPCYQRASSGINIYKIN